MSTDILEPTPTLPMRRATGPAAEASCSRMPPSGTPASPPLTPEDLERTRQLLMRNIGPIADVVITRAAVNGYAPGISGACGQQPLD